MPVSIQMPQQQESGLDKFLRRLGGVTGIASQGLSAYSTFTKGQLEKDLMNKQIANYETDQRQKGEDAALSRLLQQAQLRELERKPEKEAQEYAFKEKEFKAKQQERKDIASEKEAAKKEAAQEKIKQSVQEVDYRTNSLNSTLNNLENLIKEYGTVEVFGPQSEQMDQLIYNAALDYAKLVDPESVAREGEVVAAQKYSLPVKGMGISNASAIKLIQDMKAKANERAAQIKQTKGLSDLTSTKGISDLTKTQAPQNVPTGYVKVSNGKEEFVIPQSKQQEAMSEGYKVVQ